MKGTPQSTTSQTRPANPDNAVNFPATTLKRTGMYLPGALLLFALIGVVSYGAASSTDSQKSSQQETTVTTPVDISDVTNDQSQPADQTATNPSEGDSSVESQRSSVSTKIVTQNGQTTMTVNGQPVDVPQNGSSTQSVTSDNGNEVEIRVTQGNDAARRSSTSIDTDSTTSISTRQSGTTRVEVDD